MLDTVRAFARELAAAQGQWPGAGERHARYFVELAETAAREFLGPAQAHWMEQVLADYDNLRQAMAWCVDQAPTKGLRIAAALERFYEWRGNRREGQAWLTAAAHAGRPGAGRAAGQGPANQCHPRLPERAILRGRGHARREFAPFRKPG